MESIPGSDIGMRRMKSRPEDPMMHVSPEVRKKLEPLINHDDSHQRQGYDLATTLQPDMIVFPKDGVPYTRKPYEGDDYLEDLAKSKSWQDEKVFIDGLRKNYYANFREVFTNLKKAYEARHRFDHLRSLEVKHMVDDAEYDAIMYAFQIAPRLGILTHAEKMGFHQTIFGSIFRRYH